MPELAELIKLAVSLFAIVDPIGSIPLYLSATQGWPAERRARTARAAALTVFAVLGLAAFSGVSLLHFFGISLASFSVGGGLLLLLLSISMLQARSSPLRQTEEEAQEAIERESVGVVPLGVPLLAGPGAITQVILASHNTGAGLGLHNLALLLPIAAVALSVWVIFRAALPLSRRLGPTGTHLVTRLMGLIIAAISVEMIARGLSELFPGLAG
ncbi:MAG: NAAT family transporter [Thiobacillaceae bacterium]|nr:NAAT family transporter [Thiobacillaceae bacterium]MCX7674083.1 NAAT family transporter [Thiobacillaceae bacterium]MDW8324670.1 NAAT family transporter [Burkholderiales bacterium]